MATAVGPAYPGETYRPRHKPQDPDENGDPYGWLGCTCYAFAMGADSATLGRLDVSGRKVRALIDPPDWTGGTNLQQMDGVADRLGISFVRRNGSNFATPAEVAGFLRAGRPVEVQGWSGVWIGTTWQSTRSGVNHAELWNEARGWKRLSSGVIVPTDVLVYDPAADGDNGRDQGPSWKPWDRSLAFAARLDVSDPDEPYTVLGAGRLYAGVFADKEPHAIYRFGGRRTDPWPDRTRANPQAGKRYVNVRSRPDRINSDDIVRRLDEGDLFTAWQVTTSGARVGGSTHWRGNQDGTEWIPNARLTHKGGAT